MGIVEKAEPAYLVIMVLLQLTTGRSAENQAIHYLSGRYAENSGGKDWHDPSRGIQPGCLDPQAHAGPSKRAFLSRQFVCLSDIQAKGRPLLLYALSNGINAWLRSVVYPHRGMSLVSNLSTSSHPYKRPVSRGRDRLPHSNTSRMDTRA